MLSLMTLVVAVAPPVPVRDRDGTPLPDHAVARLGSAKMRVYGQVGRVAISADGRRAACLAVAKTLDVFDSRSGSLLRRVPLPADAGHGLSFTDGGDLFVTGGKANVGYLVDRATFAVGRISWPGGDDRRFVGLSPDGSFVLAQTGSSDFSLVNRVTGATVTRMHSDDDGTLVPRRFFVWNREFAFSPDGCRLASANVHGCLDVFDAKTGNRDGGVGPFAGDGQLWWRIAYDPTGQYLARYHSGRVLIHDGATGKELFDLKGRFSRADVVGWDDRTGRLLVLDEFMTLHRIDPKSGRSSAVLLGPTRLGDFVYGDFRGGVLVVVRGRSLLAFDVRSGRPLHPEVVEQQRGDGIVFPRLGVTGLLSPDGTLRTFDADFRPLGTSRLWPEGDRNVLAFCPRGRRVTTMQADRLAVFDVTRGKEECSLPAVGATWAEFDGDGAFVDVSRKDDERRYLYHASTGEFFRTVGPVSLSDALSPDGRRRVRCYDADKRSCLVETLTEEVIRRIDLKDAACCAFHPRGNEFVVVASDGRVARFNLTSPRPLLECRLPTPKKVDYDARPRRVLYAPDGRSLAVASRFAVHVLDEYGRLAGKLADEGMQVEQFAFTPEGSCLVATYDDGTATVYRLPRP